MPFTPFHIRCTTCESKLAVRSPQLLGHLLACPKCGSMVQIPQQEPEAVTDSGVMIPSSPPSPPVAPIAEAPPVLPAVAVSPATEEPQPLIRRRPQHGSEKSTRIIVSIVLLSVVFVLAVAYIAVLFRSGPDETSPPQPSLQQQSPPQQQPQTQETAEAPPLVPEDDDTITENEEQSPDEPMEPEDTAEILEQEPEIVATLSEDEVPEEPDPVVPLTPRPIRERAVIDVDERLRLPLAALKAERTTLYDAATTLGTCAGVPLTWDVPGMRLFGISRDTPLRLDLEESTVGEMLSALLSQNGLAMLIEHEQIFIYPIAAADATLREVRYDLSDFPPTLSSQEMAGVIPRLIGPFSWQDHGGTGSLAAEGNVLTVRQAEIHHREIVRFFEMIRSVRKLPLLSAAGKTPQEAERIQRELFPEQTCEEILDKPLSLHYAVPTPLADIFRVLEPALERDLNLRILVNHRTLNESQSPFDELSGTVHVEKGTVRDVLRQLLHSVDQTELTYRIVDANTVEIISRDAALLPEYETLESHFYGTKLRGQTETPEEMIAILKNTVEPESWAETTFGGGATLLDDATETFFMRQSQPVQRIVHAWLKE